MPIARLAKARKTLPKDYQFGDAAFERCATCGAPPAHHYPSCDVLRELMGVQALRMESPEPFHPADTSIEPEGYGLV